MRFTRLNTKYFPDLVDCFQYAHLYTRDVLYFLDFMYDIFIEDNTFINAQFTRKIALFCTSWLFGRWVKILYELRDFTQ